MLVAPHTSLQIYHHQRTPEPRHQPTTAKARKDSLKLCENPSLSFDVLVRTGVLESGLMCLPSLKRSGVRLGQMEHENIQFSTIFKVRN